MASSQLRSIDLVSPLDVQSNQNTYAANFKFDDEFEPSEFEFYYRTNSCGEHNPAGRTPHLQIYSTKQSRTGNTFAYSFGFILLDYPVPPTEKLSLGCIFYFPE